MTLEIKFEARCEPDDPNRCQAGSGNGQCSRVALPNATTCTQHQGMVQVKKLDETKNRLYRLMKYQNRVNEIADHEGIKSLREEIGILRMLLEETLNRCKDTSELLMFSSKISDFVVKIEKLVVSCHRLETSSGSLLDKNAVLHLASVIVTIIGNYIEDMDVMNLISGEIVKAIVEQHSEVKV